MGVAEDEIALAVKDLAHQGLLVEPASAVALAAFRSLEVAGQISTDRATVLVLTGAGVKWPQAMAELFPGQPLSGIEALREVLLSTGDDAPGRPDEDGPH